MYSINKYVFVIHILNIDNYVMFNVWKVVKAECKINNKPENCLIWEMWRQVKILLRK